MIKRIFSTSFYSILSRIFSTGSNLFMIYFIGQYLPDEDLGLYAIIFFFFQLFILLSSWGLDIFIGKEVAHFKNNPKRMGVIFSDIVASMRYGLILSITAVTIVSLLYHKLTFTFLIASLLLGILLGLERNLSGFLLGKERMNLEAVFSFISLLVLVSGSLIFNSRLTLMGLLIVRMVSLMAGIGGRCIFVFKWITFVKPRWQLKYFKESKFYWFMNASALVFRRVDIFILSFFIDKTVLGEYFLAITIYISLTILSDVLSIALTPFISRVYHGKERTEFHDLKRKLLIFSGFGGVLLLR